ncbi:hypothetical protein PX52LOC_02161 [Limnoglobus roseus]|uniref:Zinc ribbon domain-containing protein n=1 Tax=Limnoglobus roseus TaxID=2598579 RepID=A0A5C1AB49_9BACT|nr:hypothetical protein PX52LOC_02161 [Limnoglobus roseus]
MRTTWTVKCAKCQHAWTLVGIWSEYEREAIESRPCPKCQSYTLSSPEPAATARKTIRRPFQSPIVNCRAAA